MLWMGAMVDLRQVGYRGYLGILLLSIPRSASNTVERPYSQTRIILLQLPQSPPSTRPFSIFRFHSSVNISYPNQRSRHAPSARPTTPLLTSRFSVRKGGSPAWVGTGRRSNGTKEAFRDWREV